MYGNPSSRKRAEWVVRLLFSYLYPFFFLIFFLLLLKPFCRGFLRLVKEETGNAEGEVCQMKGGNPHGLLCYPFTHVEWPDGPGLNLPKANLTWGPPSSMDAQNPPVRTPFPADGGGGQDRGHMWAGHCCLQPNSSAQPWPVVSAVTVPFQGLWPSPSRRETVHLANKTLGCKFFQPRRETQVTDTLCGQCKTDF